MSRLASRLGWPVVVTAAVLITVGAVVTWGAVSTQFSTALLVVANLVIFSDLLDLLVRLYLRASHAADGGLLPSSGPSVDLGLEPFTPYQKRLHLKPYALLVSVHNATEELPMFFEAAQAHRHRFWAVDDASSDDTCSQMHLAGFRCKPLAENRKKPGAIRELLKSLPTDVETVVVLDPDMTFLDSSTSELSDLEEVIADFQRSGLEAVCPRVAVRPDGWLARFQGFEYCLSQCLGRKSLGSVSVNSGVSIYHRATFEEVLRRHSLSVYAEDLENSVLILSDGGRIYFDDRLTVETEGKRTLPGLFSQRVGWAFGHIKVYGERMRELRRVAGRSFVAAYQFLVYLGLATLVMHPIRVAAAGVILLSMVNVLDGLLGLALVPNVGITDPRIFTTTYYQYLVLTVLGLGVAVPSGERLRHSPIVPLYFFYSLFLIVPTSIGYLNWLSLRLFRRRLYADHYHDAPVLLNGTTDREVLREVA